MHPHSLQKCAKKAMCARTLPENTPGRQCASALSPKMRREGNVRLHSPQNRARKAKCARTLPENTPGRQNALALPPKMRQVSHAQARNAKKRGFLCFLPQSGKNASFPHENSVSRERGVLGQSPKRCWERERVWERGNSKKSASFCAFCRKAAKMRAVRANKNS